MSAPVDQVRALRVEDVAERGVPVVARAAEHRVVTADAAREQDAVAVNGKDALSSWWNVFEVVRVPHADRGFRGIRCTT